MGQRDVENVLKAPTTIVVGALDISPAATFLPSHSDHESHLRTTTHMVGA